MTDYKDNTANTIKKTQNRVKLILVDEIPDDYIKLCIPNLGSILSKFDEDTIRGLLERNLVYKLSDSSIVYTAPSTDTTAIFIKDATKINSPQLLLILAKYPKAEIVLFLTKESENLSKSDPFLSVIETNHDELNIESWRMDTQNVEKVIPPTLNNTVLDAKEIIEKFKNEMNEIIITNL